MDTENIEREARKMLPKNLHPILDYELARGNKIVQIQTTPLGGSECGVILEQVFDFDGIESKLNIDWPIAHTEPVEPPLEGYECMHKEIGVFGPQRRKKTQEEWVAELSPALKILLEKECAQGNSIERINPWSEGGPIVARLHKALARETMNIAKEQPNVLSLWDCWDAHYPIEEGIQCLKTKDTLAGPPRIFEKAASLFLKLADTIVEGRFAELATGSGGKISAESFADTVKRVKKVLLPPSLKTLLCNPMASCLHIRPIPDQKEPTWKAYLSLQTEIERTICLFLYLRELPDGNFTAIIEDFAVGVIDSIEEFGSRVPSGIISARLIEEKRAKKSKSSKNGKKNS